MPLNSISPKAGIGKNVSIGDFTVIHDDVIIGNNVEISSNVFIGNGARISDNVKIFHGAVISNIPQDLKFKGEYSILEIGEDTIIREFATLHRGTIASGKTVIGSKCLIMAYAHVAHDCIIGNNVILANSVNLGGHVEVDDNAILGGMSAIHQYVKIGKHSLLQATTYAVKDVPPYVIAAKQPVKYEGINTIGLRRRGFTSNQIEHIKDIYNMLFHKGLNISDAINEIKNRFEETAESKEILDFIKRSTRGIIASN